jgi:hypothetical protein
MNEIYRNDERLILVRCVVFAGAQVAQPAPHAHRATQLQPHTHRHVLICLDVFRHLSDYTYVYLYVYMYVYTRLFFCSGFVGGMRTCRLVKQSMFVPKALPYVYLCLCLGGLVYDPSSDNDPSLLVYMGCSVRHTPPHPSQRSISFLFWEVDRI